MRVSEYISKRLSKDFNVRHVFMLTGGGSMFLNHDIGTNPLIQTIFNHHEQACAMAAESYARITGKPGVVNVTTGPGGINALNGVFGAWTDSIPMLVLSGQVKRETFIGSYDLPGLRQLGDQEIDIVPMVRGITKYAVTITDPQSIRYHLERAWYLSQSGRPGPCWLDIPIDIQSSIVSEDVLKSYDPREDERPVDHPSLNKNVAEVLSLLKTANRPVILAGSGVRHAKAVDVFLEVVNKLGIPVTTGWTHDLISSDDPLFCGRPGTIGTRGGNFTVQNSDVLLILGSRLNIRQTGYNWKSFARAAYKIWVDVDAAEFIHPTVKPDFSIQADLHDFICEMNSQMNDWDKSRFENWLAWCKKRNERYPPMLQKYREFHGRINPYYFIDELFKMLKADDVIVTGNSTACIVPFQVARIKLGQRLFSNSGSASMGYDLPAAIGAAVARQDKRVICLAGDGSIQLNIQELQTIKQYELPIKIFVLNNDGYLSIRLSQKSFFGDTVGESPTTGVSFPDIIKLAGAYGLQSCRLDTNELADKITEVLNSDGPFICEVILDSNQGLEPRQSSHQLPDGRIVSAPLEDMYPFLDRAELLDNLLIPPWEDN